MSLWSRIRDSLERRRAPDELRETGESDTAAARTRATGGVPDPEAPDTHSTTGTTPSQTFVGRASGDDPGDVEESGAEKRADAEEEPPEDEPGSSGKE
jgi:hypothetical protein